MKYHTIYFHFVYENNSFTIEEKVNIDCIILNIYSFSQKSIWIRYVRPDGALTFAEYYNNYRHIGELLSVSIIPEYIYESITHFKILNRELIEKILDYI
jgi:hypothetical protein